MAKKLNLLMVGGSSSIGQSFLDLNLDEQFNIYCTQSSNTLKTIPKYEYKNFYLNLALESTIDSFIEELKNINFDVIILLIGKTSGLNLLSSRSLISDYFQTYIRNYCFLISEIIKSIRRYNVDKAVLINISSRSVIYGSLDPFYAMSKSAMHTFIKSIGKSESAILSAYNLVPGLLKNSSMYLEMPSTLRVDHDLRAGGNLMTVDEFAYYLYQFIVEDKKGIKEIDIKVGPQYL